MGSTATHILTTLVRFKPHSLQRQAILDQAPVSTARLAISKILIVSGMEGFSTLHMQQRIGKS